MIQINSKSPKVYIKIKYNDKNNSKNEVLKNGNEQNQN